MTPERFQYWLNKGEWTIEEASSLLRSIEPSDDATKKTTIEENIIQDRIVESIFEETKNSAWLDDELADRSEGGFYLPCFIFYGYEVRNPYCMDSIFSFKFPVEAFRKFAEKELFPKNKEYADIPIFGLFHSLDDAKKSAKDSTKSAAKISQEERLEELSRPVPAPIEQRAEAKDTEIISGITVNQIKSFVDSNSAEYRPRLEVLLRVLIQLAGKAERTISYETTLKKECEALLKAREIGSKTHETAQIEVARADIDAIKRIISKNKVTTGGRPPKEQE